MLLKEITVGQYFEYKGNKYYKEDDTLKDNVFNGDDFECESLPLDTEVKEIDDSLPLCKKCGAPLFQGYKDGDDHYCGGDGGKECLPYTEDEWSKMCDENDDDCYWTEFHDF